MAYNVGDLVTVTTPDNYRGIIFTVMAVYPHNQVDIFQSRVGNRLVNSDSLILHKRQSEVTITLPEGFRIDNTGVIRPRVGSHKCDWEEHQLFTSSYFKCRICGKEE